MTASGTRVKILRMFRPKTDRENKRFYLFPGQGGAALRRKRNKFLMWSVIVALTLSAVLTALMYWLDEMKPR